MLEKTINVLSLFFHLIAIEFSY